MGAWKNISYFPSKILQKTSNMSKRLNGTAPPLSRGGGGWLCEHFHPLAGLTVKL